MTLTLNRYQAGKLVPRLPRKGEKVLVVHEWLHNIGGDTFELRPLTPLDALDSAFETFAGVLIGLKVPDAHAADFERDVMKSGHYPEQSEGGEGFTVFYFKPGWFDFGSGGRGYFTAWLLSTRNTKDPIKLLLPNTPRGRQLFHEWAAYKFGISCYVKTHYLLNWFGECKRKRP